MPEEPTQTQLFLARLVVVIAVIAAVMGVVMYGSSTDVHQRIWKDILERPGGPMTFRFILQPCMAAIAAFHDGVKDAKAGRTPYVWALLKHPAKSGGRLREGLIATARIILLGFGMDAIYQVTVLKTFYPVEMLLVAILLAFVPYLLFRGPVERLAKWWLARRSAT